MFWMRKSGIEVLSTVRAGSTIMQALRCSVLALGMLLLSGVGLVSETRPAGAQDVGRIIRSLRLPVIRDRHRAPSRREKGKVKEEADTKGEKTISGDGKNLGTKGEQEVKAEPTRVGDGGSGTNGPGPGGGGSDKGQTGGPGPSEKGPSEKPRGEAPDFTPR